MHRSATRRRDAGARPATIASSCGSRFVIRFKRTRVSERGRCYTARVSAQCRATDGHRWPNQRPRTDLHVIGEAEAPLERAPGDAAVQVTVAALLLFFLVRLARHQEGVLLNSDIEFGRGEPGHGHGQPKACSPVD